MVFLGSGTAEGGVLGGNSADDPGGRRGHGWLLAARNLGVAGHTVDPGRRCWDPVDSSLCLAGSNLAAAGSVRAVGDSILAVTGSILAVADSILAVADSILVGADYNLAVAGSEVALDGILYIAAVSLGLAGSY